MGHCNILVSFVQSLLPVAFSTQLEAIEESSNSFTKKFLGFKVEKIYFLENRKFVSFEEVEFLCIL